LDGWTEISFWKASVLRFVHERRATNGILRRLGAVIHFSVPNTICPVIDADLELWINFWIRILRVWTEENVGFWDRNRGRKSREFLEI
jgi:hypothetical protein